MWGLKSSEIGHRCKKSPEFCWVFSLETKLWEEIGNFFPRYFTRITLELTTWFFTLQMYSVPCFHIEMTCTVVVDWQNRSCFCGGMVPKKSRLFVFNVAGNPVCRSGLALRLSPLPCDVQNNSKTEFLSVVTLCTSPPQFFNGIGPTPAEAGDIAAVEALRKLSDEGLEGLCGGQGQTATEATARFVTKSPNRVDATVICQCKT